MGVLVCLVWAWPWALRGLREGRERGEGREARGEGREDPKLGGVDSRLRETSGRGVSNPFRRRGKGIEGTKETLDSC